MRLWQVDIHPANGQPDSLGLAAVKSATELGIASDLAMEAAYGFLLQGDLDETQANKIANELLADPIAQRCVTAIVGQPALNAPRSFSANDCTLIYSMPKAGVMDPVAQSTLNMLLGLKYPVEEVRTFRKYWVRSAQGAPEKSVVQRLCQKILANDSIEQVNVGPLQMEQLAVGAPYQFQLV
ncbi:MAG: phosphoribosylformylglycinamidine synthase subunit PurS, partial [Pirellula sp.]